MEQRIARAGAALRPIDTRVHAERNEVLGPPTLEDRLRRLPDCHPSSPQRPLDSRTRDDVRPLTDAEHADHVADVKARLADARGQRLETRFQHTVDSQHEIWTDERDASHDAILNDLYARAESVPCEYRAIVAGGLPGAGKTTVLTQQAGLDLSRYMLVNPDLIKAEMARRGLVPVVDGLTPMEATALAHEESSHIAKRLAHRAQSDGRNVIWDVTMSKPATCTDRINALRAAGYEQLDAVFVHIPIEASLRRVDSRHRAGHDEYRAGVGFGGRFAPQEMILAQYHPVWGSINRANFELVKDRLSSWSLYSNSVDDRPAKLTDHSNWNR